MQKNTLIILGVVVVILVIWLLFAIVLQGKVGPQQTIPANQVQIDQNVPIPTQPANTNNNGSQEVETKVDVTNDNVETKVRVP
ncbi:hypothetical protein ACFL2B_01980 [Patescibacteria group bacterium]